MSEIYGRSGIRSLEDNGLLKRSVEDQEKLGTLEWAR